ncbi:ABC transporter permease [Enterococcus durans]|uniref:ABC transporter permease n=1 Tax=Enterococcus durans TaxID=53345 RepID=UPI0018845651|nr:ABC transporter permease [Enterococcus durans]MBE9886150.1 ABC transporter permease [Enterococcus durans]
MMMYFSQSSGLISIEKLLVFIEKKEQQQKILSIFFTLFIFLFTSFAATSIVQEIGKDKGTKLIEIILTNIKPEQYFLGKLIAVVILTMLQILIYGLSFLLVLISIFQNPKFHIDLDVFLEWNVLVSLFYMIFGVTIFSFIASIAGSMIKRIEDISNGANLALTLSLIGTYLGLWVTPFSPTSWISEFGAYFPFFSPFVVPVKLVVTDITVMEILYSSVILICSNIAILLLSISLYKKNCLNYYFRTRTSD